MQGAVMRARRQAERDIGLAHTTATLTRAKRIEPLAHYLRRPGPRGPMLDRLKAIAAATAELG